MGVSTDAILCYGISFEEEYEFPWDDCGDSEYDSESWWLEQCGYKPPFELFTKEGDYLPGPHPPDEKITAYFSHRREFLQANPLPVEVVMHCHGDYAMWILAVPGTVTKASRGYPEQIQPPLAVSVDGIIALEDFCEQWKLDGDGPAWWLASLWF